MGLQDSFGEPLLVVESAITVSLAATEAAGSPAASEPALLQSQFVRQFSPQIQSRLCALGSYSTLPVGHYLTTQGEAIGCFAVVLSGTLALSVHRGSDRLQLALARTGDAIGATNLLDRRPPSADIVVVAGPARVWTLTRTQFEELSATDLPSAFIVLQALAQELCRRMRQHRDTLLHQLETVRSYYCEMEV
ncbi:MAG: Crp/Fnr family transcriptional regulator [Verrucomicrobiales bacterium]